jgi:potassium efflux system protein
MRSAARFSACQASIRVFLLLVLLSPGWAQEAQPGSIESFRAAHPVIRYAADPDFAPIDMVERGVHSGLAKDYLDHIARASGLRFERVSFPLWADALSAFRRGEVDLLSSAFVSSERRAYALFTQPYLRPGAVVLTRVDEAPIRVLADLGKRPVAFVEASVWLELLGEEGSALNLQPRPRLADALRALATAEVDALVADPVTALEQALRIGLQDQIKVAIDLGFEVPVAMAVRKDWPELKTLIDQQLAAISVEDEARMRARWMRPAGGDQQPSDAALEAVTIPAGERARIEALLDPLGEEDSPAANTLREALALETQADNLLAQIEAMQSEPAVPVMAELTAAERLQRFLLWRASLPERASVEELQKLLEDEQAALDASESRRRELSLQLRDLRQRQLDLPVALEARRTSSDNAEQPGAAASSVEGRLLAGARQRLTLAQVSSMRFELRLLPARIQDLELQVDRERGNVVRFRQRVAALQDLKRERVVRVAEAHLDDARRALQGLQAESPSDQQQAQEVVQLAELGVLLAQRYALGLPELQEQSRKAARVSESLMRTRQRLALDIGSIALGRVLLAERRQLDRVQDISRLRRRVEAELAQLRLDQIELDDRRSRLSDEATFGTVGPEEHSTEALTHEWRRQDMLVQHRFLLGEAIPLAALLQSTLEATARELQRREDETRELRSLIDQRLIWLPTHSVFAVRGWEGSVQDLFKPSRWIFSGRLLLDDVAARPWIAGLAAGLIFVLWWARRKLLAKVQEIVGLAARNPLQSIAPALRATAMSLLAAAFWPLLLLLFGRHLQQLGSFGKFTHSVGTTLIWLAPYLYALTALRAVTISDGLARILGWDMQRVRKLHRLAMQLIWIAIPPIFLIVLQVQRGSEQGAEDLGRPLLLLMFLALAVLVWRASPNAGSGASLRRAGAAVEASSLRRRVPMLLSLTLLALAIFQASGYGLISLVLFVALARSVVLILAILLLRDVLLHWLLVQEQKLSQQRYQEQLQTRLEAMAADQLGSDAPPVLEPKQINIESISGQTRRLLRAALWTIGGLTLLWLWSDLLPALEALDGVSLWQLGPAEGETVGQIVSLRDVLLGVLMLILTVIGSNNLPGLLEIAVLQRFPFDSATRYAITSVSRYVITITGVVLAVGQLGIRWGDLQFLAAALTVGLGFGLQEIFANFVSGLILLFERPFRVGDTITIGQLTGKVTRIRTRATTILDWDNCEIVIPNKSFITGDLVNWTLSDTITRITIKVSAAYGSDPEQVLKLLREVAEAHPRVLSEPKPTSWLIAFGASSIDFELRVFVPEIRDRLPVSTELATQVHRRFREAGIEIPFPQLDLHLRSGKLDGEPAAA